MPLNRREFIGKAGYSLLFLNILYSLPYSRNLISLYSQEKIKPSSLFLNELIYLSKNEDEKNNINTSLFRLIGAKNNIDPAFDLDNYLKGQGSYRGPFRNDVYLSYDEIDMLVKSYNPYTESWWVTGEDVAGVLGLVTGIPGIFYKPLGIASLALGAGAMYCGNEEDQNYQRHLIHQNLQRKAYHLYNNDLLIKNYLVEESNDLKFEWTEDEKDNFINNYLLENFESDFSKKVKKYFGERLIIQENSIREFIKDQNKSIEDAKKKVKEIREENYKNKYQSEQEFINSKKILNKLLLEEQRKNAEKQMFFNSINNFLSFTIEQTNGSNDTKVLLSGISQLAMHYAVYGKLGPGAVSTIMMSTFIGLNSNDNNDGFQKAIEQIFKYFDQILEMLEDINTQLTQIEKNQYRVLNAVLSNQKLIKQSMSLTQNQFLQLKSDIANSFEGIRLENAELNNDLFEGKYKELIEKNITDNIVLTEKFNEFIDLCEIKLNNIQFTGRQDKLLSGRNFSDVFNFSHLKNEFDEIKFKNGITFKRPIWFDIYSRIGLLPQTQKWLNKNVTELNSISNPRLVNKHLAPLLSLIFKSHILKKTDKKSLYERIKSWARSENEKIKALADCDSLYKITNLYIDNWKSLLIRLNNSLDGLMNEELKNAINSHGISIKFSDTKESEKFNNSDYGGRLRYLHSELTKHKIINSAYIKSNKIPKVYVENNSITEKQPKPIKYFFENEFDIISLAKSLGIVQEMRAEAIQKSPKFFYLQNAPYAHLHGMNNQYLYLINNKRSVRDAQLAAQNAKKSIGTAQDVKLISYRLTRPNGKSFNFYIRTGKMVRHAEHRFIPVATGNHLYAVPIMSWQNFICIGTKIKSTDPWNNNSNVTKSWKSNFANSDDFLSDINSNILTSIESKKKKNTKQDEYDNITFFEYLTILCLVKLNKEITNNYVSSYFTLYRSDFKDISNITYSEFGSNDYTKLLDKVLGISTSLCIIKSVNRKLSKPNYFYIPIENSTLKEINPIGLPLEDYPLDQVNSIYSHEDLIKYLYPLLIQLLNANSNSIVETLKNLESFENYPEFKIITEKDFMIRKLFDMIENNSRFILENSSPLDDKTIYDYHYAEILNSIEFLSNNKSKKNSTLSTVLLAGSAIGLGYYGYKRFIKRKN
ncbi:hypothetical protein [uncultured Winogradskyella sp.]|uniref:hypothetical protein n=1 Tax=uncultured Winogradskyella sp. TaxID=395353 RepID=UPI0026279CF7|nr:hypothetical protein [uncultured Winogradskyella sp.]